MAKGIPESTIEEIKARTDLADLIASYGIALRHVGGTAKACCPFHNEKTPSFVVNPTKGFFHCFGCGASGDAINFVMRMDGCTFFEAATKLANAAGVKIEQTEDPDHAKRKRLYALMAELAAFYHRCLQQTSEAQLARDYLAKRQLEASVQDDFLIGYAPNGMMPLLKWAEKHGYTMDELDAAGVAKPPTRAGDHGFHRFGGRLMFSIKDKQGRVVAFSGRQLIEKKNSGKYVNSPETLIFKKSNILFGFDRAASAIAKSPSREVICCEGQIDTIRLHINGWPTAVASQGTAFTEEHAKMIHRVADAALLMYDDDSAGHNATIKVARLLLAKEMPVRVVSLPGGADPDSFLVAHGADEMKKQIEKAESIVAFQCRVERAKEASPNSIDAISRVAKSVLTTLAYCSNAVLRATLVNEAAHALSVPVVALTEELAKIKIAPTPSASKIRENSNRENFEADVDADSDGEDFRENWTDDDNRENSNRENFRGETPEIATPPSAHECALMSFLLANEGDNALNELVTEFLPSRILAHDFTIRFLAMWQDNCATGDSEKFAIFANALSPFEHAWFDKILMSANKAQASELNACEIMVDFIRMLWCDELTRRRGALPACGDGEAERQRLQLSFAIKKIQQMEWAHAQDEIKNFMKGEN